MDNREGNQPDSIKPGHPSAETYREGSPAPAPTATDEPEAPVGFLTPTNRVIIGLLAALVLYLLYKFTFDEMWAILKAGLGLSFVIFIHELGHFLAAKWCGVNVTTFSIGFGPAIPGCQFTWGETNYRLAVLPLGGYVQMVGQIDGDESDTASDDDPRSYRKKTVGQRMLIISAGVIMNAILAVVCFIAVYQGPGKEHPVAVIDNVDPGAPAFKDGLRTGGKFTKFGDIDDPTFTDLMQTVINSMKEEWIPVTYQRPGDQPVSTKLEAMILDDGSERPKRPIIGVLAPRALRLISKYGAADGPYFAGTSAADAKFEFGDVIVAMTDPFPAEQADPKKYRADLLKDLPDDPRTAEPGKQRDYFEFSKRMQLLADRKVIVVVRRGLEGKQENVKLEVAPMHRVNLGVRMPMGPVLAVRKGSPADSKVRPPNPQASLKGDVIGVVSVVDADGTVLEFKDKTLDPERLPFQLRQWSDRMDRAGKKKDDRIVTLRLARASEEKKGGPDTIIVEEKLTWDSDWRFDHAAPGMRTSPMAIPELGLAYEIRAMVAEVTTKNSPLEVGDVIKSIRFDSEDFKEEIPMVRELLYQAIPPLRPEHRDYESKWIDLEEGQWANIASGLLEQPIKFKKLLVKVKRGDAVTEFEIPVEIDRTWPLPERGWKFAPDTRRVRASGPIDAVGMGLKDTKNRMTEVFQNLRGMIFGRISFKNLGGPLTIAAATYRFAFMDFAEFTFFLGLISINLAVVNFLPIPVLDGGHMVFLIYEKLRGQPASENVRIWSTYAGLAMILALMIFVLYLDVSRLFF